MHLAGEGWHKVVLTRMSGEVSVAIDGKDVAVNYVNKGGLGKVVFFLHLNAGDTAAIRRFEVEVAGDAAKRP